MFLIVNSINPQSLSQRFWITLYIYILYGAKADWDFQMSDLVKTLMEQIFKPCGEFRWSLEGPDSQIHSPQLHTGAPRIFSHILMFVQMLNREWVRKATGSYTTYSSTVNLEPCFLSFAVEDLPSAELQPWFMRFQCWTCPWAQNTDDDRGEGWLEFPDLWSGQKPWWNWYLTSVVNFGEVRRAQLANFTL